MINSPISRWPSSVISQLGFTRALHLWLINFARSTLTEACEKGVLIGHLTIVDTQGTYSFGSNDKQTEPHVTIEVVNDAFWTRVLFGGDLGFGEAYLAGDIKTDDLKGAFQIWLDNRSSLECLSAFASRVITSLSAISSALIGQTQVKSRLNAIASYDTSNALFECFLSKEMQYSCALWVTPEEGLNPFLLDQTDTPEVSLESAQTRKLHHVLRAARVKPGDRILEFGSGWGALAITAAKYYKCTVDTITLSTEQKKLAEERIRSEGLENLITVHLCDYRDLPKSFEKAFDAFVSIEMIEHVGPRYYKTYFKLVDWALKSQSATAVVTTSTCPEGRWTAYQTEDFCRKYIWPNGTLPSPTILITSAAKATKSRLQLECVENHSAHYPRTLRTWAHNLATRFPQYREKIIKDQPASNLEDPAVMEVFLRKWMYLFGYAEAGFEKGYIGCHMFTWRRL
ncbi:cyclopropane-fatty-acyl-phospholipid synthase [Sistotremastrum suecicum HHB10207 ss-3]|uniref:Cyclopropane-fatty-acyl-phospholipid synthase n=1 Tax=Sistotremastrum suecicum HHB10207 ss-3 TaxID=1314776 RepID=A0A166B382_9AGAM|nr:cyclopropane-fatty-acyl-phospholipid synthase [Sistotremastrum suecicum HHB10207 ss-3]